MSIVYGRGLPVIKLCHWLAAPNTPPLTVNHTLGLSILHNIQGMRIAEAEEFDAADMRMADSGRSLVSHRAGFRWMLDFVVDSHFLLYDATNERYNFEGFMERMEWWKYQGAANVVRVFPYSDRADIYFDAHIPEGGFIKTPYQNESGIKTVAQQYQVSLVADSLHTTKPSTALPE